MKKYRLIRNTWVLILKKWTRRRSIENSTMFIICTQSLCMKDILPVGGIIIHSLGIKKMEFGTSMTMKKLSQLEKT